MPSSPPPLDCRPAPGSSPRPGAVPGGFRVRSPEADAKRASRLAIHGRDLDLWIWTAEEWARLPESERPNARRDDNGCWWYLAWAGPDVSP